MAGYFLGIDAGAVSVATCLLDAEGGWVRGDYRKHNGGSDEALRRLLSDYPLDRVAAYGVTGATASRLQLPAAALDSAVAQTEALRCWAPDVRHILSVGGGSFSLISLDEQGRFLKHRINSACASGTGAFLDQQALRLGVPPEDLGRVAAAYRGAAPTVATRCAVFAKTDMIHLQQEGVSVEAVAKGLCNGLGASTVDGLLGGTRITGKTALIGGVALNECVAAAIEKQLDVPLFVPDRPELADAFGAALWAMKQEDKAPFPADMLQASSAPGTPDLFRPPLALSQSSYPSFDCMDQWVDAAGTEIALLASPEAGAGRPCALGIDIGSTSTKAVLTDRSGKALAWCYRKTAGAPLQAVQHVFRGFRALEEKYGIRFDVSGCGTTGSGRKMVGQVIGADLVLNEITAHARAAVAIDPGVETILELGGQDAKFTQLSGGVVYNSVMNYVCAAGTGSFIEEQAQKLGIPIEAFADLAMGIEAPVTSDRCTVYMERDLDMLLAAGMSKAQVAAAVLHSVCENYLTKVAAGLSVGRRVMFQGATARNKALVAAFENRLGVPIQVSPLCHVTGALGMALLVLARHRGDTAFRGFGFADQAITVDHETCHLCNNQCRLSLIHCADQTVAWGLKCGREYEDRRPRPAAVHGDRFLKARQRAFMKGMNQGSGEDRPAASTRPVIGIPRSLSTYTYLPFWSAFFGALGIRTVLSPATTPDVFALGEAAVTAEFCAPVLAGLGHVRALLSPPEKAVDHVFMPHMIRDACPDGFTNSCFCCYVQAYPSIADSLPQVAPLLGDKALCPVVDLSDDKALTASLSETLGKPLGVGRRQVAGALREARRGLADFQAESRRQGRAALEKITREGTFGVVLVGRPYNTLDGGMNLDLPRKMSAMGYTVLYQDMLDVAINRSARQYPNMYWRYGQQILSTTAAVAEHPALFPVYFTSFSCGPDSYILSYFKDMMNRSGKPYLVLQFDGHGADAGYLTRIEAALESFQAWFDGQSCAAPSLPAGQPAACGSDHG